MGYDGYGQVMVQCPFYLRDNKLSIACEGILRETETLTKFKNEEEKGKFQKAQCFQYPNTCPIARHILKDEGRYR